AAAPLCNGGGEPRRDDGDSDGGGEDLHAALRRRAERDDERRSTTDRRSPAPKGRPNYQIHSELATAGSPKPRSAIDLRGASGLSTNSFARATKCGSSSASG